MTNSRSITEYVQEEPETFCYTKQEVNYLRLLGLCVYSGAKCKGAPYWPKTPKIITVDPEQPRS